jgi:preprotein translocase subunit SecF
MEFFNPNSNVNFMGVRRWSVLASILLMALSIGSLATRGLNLALDFTGGSLAEVTYSQPIEQQAVSASLEAAGIHNTVVQRFDSTNFAIRLGPAEVEALAKAAPATAEGESGLDRRNAQVSASLLKALSAGGRQVTVKPSVYVGPQVGADLAYNGVVAVVLVLLGIIVYIWIRFEWKFAVATVVTELHDVLLTVGFFSLTGMEFDLTVLAAILAVDGYSVNDTIVVFDRVRELFKTTRNLQPVEVLNRAVNTTLSRTIMTSLATLLTVLALFFFGGPTLHGFSTALIVGIIVGTLSSIFFANPVLLWLGVTKQDLMPKAKEDAELARRP